MKICKLYISNNKIYDLKKNLRFRVWERVH